MNTRSEIYRDRSIASIPPGFKFTPLHVKCPRCGCDLSQEFVETDANKGKAENVKGDSENLGTPRMSTDNATRKTSGSRYERSLQGVIDPLPKADEEYTEGNESGRRCGKGREQASASGQKDNDTYDHQDMVPVVERKFGKRIIHWLLRKIVKHEKIKNY